MPAESRSQLDFWMPVRRWGEERLRAWRELVGFPVFTKDTAGGIMKTTRLSTSASALLAGILGLASTVRADVTIQRSTSVQGVGAMAFANMSGTSTTTISGDSSRTDSDMKMQSKIVGFLARNAMGPSADIVVLDQDKFYHLNMNKKEYTETTFEQFRSQMQKMSDQANSAENKQQPSAIDQSKCVWLPAKVDVSKTGEKAQFAGYDAERVTVTATQPCQDKDTGAICEIALVMDLWNSPDFVMSGEAKKFYTAYASKMGMDLSNSQDASDRAKALFGQYKGVWTEVAAKMQTVKGYPVKSSFTLGLGGTQCKDKDSSAQQAQTSQTDSSPQSPSDLAGAVVGKLGGLFQKKKDNADAPAAQAAPAVTPATMPPGDVALMTVSSQLVSVSTNPASPDAFTVPPGFKKIELKGQ
jgi:hypothetical protein